MKIYINTNNEIIGQMFEVSKDTIECSLNETWLNDTGNDGGSEWQRKIQDLDDDEVVEIEFDSTFSNWQGGKHRQIKKAGMTNVWVSHKPLPADLEAKIDTILIEEIQRTSDVLDSLDQVDKS